MQPTANKSKIYAVLIICMAVVVSIWMFNKNPQNTDLTITSKTLTTAKYLENIEPNNDWQKILTDTSSSTQKIEKLLSLATGDIEDQTTVTAQISRDLFSRYLLVANQEGGLTDNQISTIASQTVSTSDDYTRVSGALYLESNLKVSADSSLEAIALYNTNLVKKLNSRTVTAKQGIPDIIASALQTENKQKLNDLNPYISSNKAVVSDLLQMQVPKDAVKLHLGLLNAYSNTLASLEAMKVVFSDPIKGIAGVGEYIEYAESVQNSLNAINQYFQTKLKN